MTDKTPEQKTLLKFPCLFPIKIMGLNKPELEKLVSSIMQDKVAKKDHKTIEYSKHLSSHENYLSITVKFMATSKKTVRPNLSRT